MSHMNMYSYLNATELTPIYKKAGKLQGGDAVQMNIKAAFSSNLSAVCLSISCMLLNTGNEINLREHSSYKLM